MPGILGLLGKKPEAKTDVLPIELICVGVVTNADGRLLHGYISDEPGNAYAEYDCDVGFQIKNAVPYPFEHDLRKAYEALLVLSTGADEVELPFSRTTGFVYRRTRDHATSGMSHGQVCIERYMTYERRSRYDS